MTTVCRLAVALVWMAVAMSMIGQRASAEEYPSRTVKIIVPYPAGGPIDVIGRTLAQQLSEAFGKPFYVENIVGAGGAIGMGAVANAPADGHTILVANENLILQPIIKAKVPFDPFKSFAPVTLVASAPMMVAVHSSLPAHNMKDLLALLKANQGKYNYASPGYGTSPHLASERLFNLTYKLNVIHVPFQGAAAAVQAVLSGEPPLFHEVLPAVAPHIRQGSMRALAVASSSRSEFFPSVPTLEETGTAGHEVGFWSGVLLPAGTPQSIVERLWREIAKAMSPPEVRGKFATMGFDQSQSTPEEFSTLLTTASAKWRKVVNDANIKIE